jgi:MFS family permease
MVRVSRIAFRLRSQIVKQSLFYLTQAMTVLHWSSLSDRIGRKPVILVGLFGISASMYCFGLSRTFWGLVVIKVCIQAPVLFRD